VTIDDDIAHAATTLSDHAAELLAMARRVEGAADVPEHVRHDRLDPAVSGRADNGFADNRRP
jgi:hypothetical protein